MEIESHLNAEQVADLLGIKKSTAYPIIRKLNEEMSAMGYYTITGRCSASFFRKKFFYKEDSSCR